MTDLRPMLASIAEASLQDPHLAYEPKYDGIRAIAEVLPGAGPRRRTEVPNRNVHLWSRLGNEKTSQFPEIVQALATWARRLKEPAVVDGEIVALDANGRPAGFQQLQGRIHVLDVNAAASGRGARTAFIVFDLLQVGRHDLRELPFRERRRQLERLFSLAVTKRKATLRLSEIVHGDGRRLYERALHEGWEGLIVKQIDSRYRPGKRTPDWRKLKIVHEQEFVVSGWTEPRHSRTAFGALLLGVYEPSASSPRLSYVGHVGTGFDARELARVSSLLAPLETAHSPFSPPPKTNERAHWTKPDLVAQVRFTEWTSDGKLRHPVYLGLRDDKKPEQIRREASPRVQAGAVAGRSIGAGAGRTRQITSTRNQKPKHIRREPSATHSVRSKLADVSQLVEKLREVEDSRKDATLELPDGNRLAVSNLHKVFWPGLKITKGDLFRYYAEVAQFILPALADRPLVMKRFPDGVGAKPFYQHRVDQAPAGIRVEPVEAAESRPHVVGGTLTTLLYTAQLAAISQDPWFSRVQSPTFADHVALDLDPAPGVPFSAVLDVARWIRDELQRVDAVGVPKTSGSEGLHIYVRLPPRTPYEAGLIFTQIVATLVAQKHPGAATVERSVRARGRRVYVDYLQNIFGKTLASAYSVRANDFAGVSAPLTWNEIEAGVDRQAFTLRSMKARLKKVGDLWAPIRTTAPVNLEKVQRYAERSVAGAKTPTRTSARRR